MRSREIFGDKGSRVGSQYLRTTTQGHGKLCIGDEFFTSWHFWLMDSLVKQRFVSSHKFFLQGIAHGHLFHSMNEFI